MMHERQRQNAAQSAGQPVKSPREVAWLALREADSSDLGGDAQEILRTIAVEAGLDARDQGLAFEIMQGVLRNRMLLDALIGRLQGFEGAQILPALQEVLRIGAYQHFFLNRIPSHALVFATVEIARIHLGQRPAAYANAALRRLLKQYPEPAEDLAQAMGDLPLDIRHSFPGWISRLVRRTVGAENWEAALEALNRPLSLHGRVNPSVASMEEAIFELHNAGIDALARGDLARWCVEINGPAGPIVDSSIFQRGGLILQDASSQLVAEFACAEPDMAVVDFCSAPGGKTTALAGAMDGKGTLLACEVSEFRMERLVENVERLGFGSFIQAFLLDPSGQGLKDLRSLLPKEGADRVLVDAPCSGLGTLRRHPEIRWRLKNADLKRLNELQGEILDRAATLARIGGRLVYSTCSLAAEENEQVIDGFLQRHAGEFEIVKPADDLPGHLGGRVNASGWLRLLPHREEMDSASAVRLKRLL